MSAGRPALPGPLRHRAFRWLLAARTTSILGNAVAPIALAFAVLDLTGSVTDLGLVVAARSVTNVAVLLAGGVLADRLPRDLLLVGASLAAALTQAAVATLVLTGTASIPALVLLGMLNGAVAAVSLPAAAALVPETVPFGELRAANALLRLGLNGSTIVGSAAGAALVAGVGPGWGLAIDAAGFALAGLLFSRLRLPRASVAPSAPGRRGLLPGLRGALAELRHGWREFTRRRWVWVAVLQFGVLNAAFVGATTVLGPLVADETVGRAGWGLVVAAQAGGLALGAVLALRWRPSRALAAGVGGMLLTTVPIAALAAVAAGGAPAPASAALPAPAALPASAALPAPAALPALLLPALILAFALGGIALEFFAIAWDQSLQTHVPREALSRVYSFDMVGSFLAIPVGEVLVGPLAQGLGTPPTLIGCAALVVAATAAALAVPAVRRLRV
ncbi:MFS transporter [Herbiconiux sp. CPCC 205716]|uniref:MFS transporter n=1 Tax=Herbiconiux gentiana TaxID=2970912 RepID=A0ABT2GIE2_9MICO|nr:MFS transporter [Herbiconiux gentiana]MCS5715992.1 MFS transporter [Herbiconiux gentiana]